MVTDTKNLEKLPFDGALLVLCLIIKIIIKSFDDLVD